MKVFLLPLIQLVLTKKVCSRLIQHKNESKLLGLLTRTVILDEKFVKINGIVSVILIIFLLELTLNTLVS